MPCRERSRQVGAADGAAADRYYSPGPQREDLLALRRMVDDAARLQLTGLTGAAVADLVAVLAGGRPGGSLLRLAEGAAGNPLYVTELVAALTRGSSLTITEAGTAELAGGSAPDSLSAAIADRLGFVAGPVRDVLRAAALLGVNFAVSDLARLGPGVPDLIPVGGRDALPRGVLAESGHGLGFRHPLDPARQLYDEMSAPVRTAWHRDAGRALAEAGAPADRVARQMLRAVGGPAAQGPSRWTSGCWTGWLLNTIVFQSIQLGGDEITAACPTTLVFLVGSISGDSGGRNHIRESTEFKIGLVCECRQISDDLLGSALG